MASGNFAYGQADPTKSTTQFNRVAFLISQMAAQLETMKLVQVVKVNSNGELAAAGTVDVLLLVNQIDGNANGSPHGVVYGIPWFRLQGALNAVICDPKVGDIGYVVAADRDISSVKATKKQANPPSRRRFSISDGIYVGGVLNEAPTQYLAFLETGIKIVDKFGNVIETTEGGIILTPKGGEPVLLNGDLNVTGEITAKSGTADSVGLSSHTHIAHGSGAPTDPPTGGT